MPLGTIPVVQLRRKGWLFSSLVDDMAVWNDAELDWGYATELVANEVLKRHNARIERNKFIDKAYGSYPPKTTKDWQ